MTSELGTTLVTGANRGLGRALVLELAGRGTRVIATARRVEELADLPADQRLALDVTSPESVGAAAAAAGPVDTLINNAGISVGAAVEDTPADVAAALFDTNVLGPMRLISAFVPGMRERGSGTVVNVSSVGAHASFPLNGVSGACKSALETISETLALEAGPLGIRVIVLQLGAVGTDMFEHQPRYVSPAYEHLDRAQREAYAAGQGRGADPADVARQIVDRISSADTPLRIPIGDDAAGLLQARAATDDAAWYARLTGGRS